ncbi:MAG: YmdB family metallophosphoesterase [Armatimonadota bacterium]
MRILFLGDIVGKSGRDAVVQHLPGMIAEFAIDFVIANGENAAAGRGITGPIQAELLSAGVDVVTLGNHAFAREASYEWFDEEQRVLRPVNFPIGVPGRGFGMYRSKSGVVVGVINTIGRVHMSPADCPFTATERAFECIRSKAAVTIVDMHAEVTSEKAALAWFLDGRVSGLIGTHTHVQTSDARLLPRGTAFLSDVGMCGVRDSILGQSVAGSIQRMKSGFGPPVPLADGPAEIHAAIVECDETTGLATGIKAIMYPCSGE